MEKIKQQYVTTTTITKLLVEAISDKQCSCISSWLTICCKGLLDDFLHAFIGLFYCLHLSTHPHIYVICMHSLLMNTKYAISTEVELFRHKYLFAILTSSILAYSALEPLAGRHAERVCAQWYAISLATFGYIWK